MTEAVILLHGLGRSAVAMLPMAWRLRRAGYTVINQGYPSRRHSVQALAERTLPMALEKAQATSPTKIHFVTHSMGGILLRCWLQAHPLPRPGRAVMLAPPNQGSELVDHVRRIPLFEKIMGPASVQLGTGDDSVPRQLAPVDAEIGVITGTRRYSPWLDPLFGDQHDGKVSVHSARLAEMADFRVMDVGHTFIMADSAVTQEVLHFLRHGCFMPSAG